MDILLILLGSICIFLAILGSLLPVLPGPIIGFAGLLLLHFTSGQPFGWGFFIVRGIVIVGITIMDYYVPIRGTKKFGGTKAGVRGSTIGLIIGTMILPILGITIGPFGVAGLIIGPFLGAYAGEKLAGRHHQHALRSAVGSFIGFLAGTFVKFIVCLIMAGYFFVNVYHVFVK
ncbi:MAG: DUF456 domain-containing protein [candidate division SR1 bacterium]|nr:DUF456 domain-containing protein [candidate division SR1 bacterium]